MSCKGGYSYPTLKLLFLTDEGHKLTQIPPFLTENRVKFKAHGIA